MEDSVVGLVGLSECDDVIRRERTSAEAEGSRLPHRELFLRGRMKPPVSSSSTSAGRAFVLSDTTLTMAKSSGMKDTSIIGLRNKQTNAGVTSQMVSMHTYVYSTGTRCTRGAHGAHEAHEAHEARAQGARTETRG